MGKKFLKALFKALLVILVTGIICSILLVRRGFRASSGPPAWEAFVARTVRNIAIPREEHDRKNPLAATSDASGQGREFFVTQCAACHGIDGSGKTLVGTNLYPRVPDLRSPATQNLSDGDLHYIIETGVQLTGMPAWSKAHSESSGDSWKLVLFIRNLRSITVEERSQQQTTASSAHYVGSQACQKCHAEIYERWKKTPMANVVREPFTHPDAIIPDLATNRIAPFTKEKIAFVYGSLEAVLLHKNWR